MRSAPGSARPHGTGDARRPLVMPTALRPNLVGYLVAPAVAACRATCRRRSFLQELPGRAKSGRVDSLRAATAQEQHVQCTGQAARIRAPVDGQSQGQRRLVTSNPYRSKTSSMWFRTVRT